MAIIKVRNPAIDLDAAEIPNLDASKITTGLLMLQVELEVVLLQMLV